MVSVFVPDGIVMAADSRQTVGITAVKPVNGAQGTETRILNRNVRARGSRGFPAGNDHIPIGQRTKNNAAQQG